MLTEIFLLFILLKIIFLVSILIGLIIILVIIFGFNHGILFFYFGHQGKKVIYSNEKYDDSIDHTAIIAIEYSGKFSQKRFFVQASGIELLVDGLKQLGESYVLYRCSTPEQFIKVVINERVKRIWIIGHGVKHGVGFGKDILYYCDVAEALQNAGSSKKEYVKQLHCNGYGGKSLIDYICETNDQSFVTDDVRLWDENRKYIKDTIEEMKKKFDKK
jgi:hypothetical protein